MGLSVQSMAIEMPAFDRHPNRAEFCGVLTFVDSPSDKPPSGAKGHRVVLTKAAADAALPSLLGMGLDYTPTLDRHDARMKIGVITSAEVVKRKRLPHVSSANVGHQSGAPSTLCIEVSGYLFARDFPDVINEMRASGKGVLGMSYEIADAQIADMKAPVWTITKCTFTGAAMLRRDKAAYRNTSIELVEPKLPTGVRDSHMAESSLR